MTTKHQEYEVDIIIHVQNILNNHIPVSEQSEEYKKIVEAMRMFLKNNCRHKLVYDHIDIDGDRTLQICYCDKCQTNFES